MRSKFDTSLKLAYTKIAFSKIQLQQLDLQCFRNYRRLQFDLTENRLIIVGPNGIGKSNFLEAVELLGSLRSHRSSRDQDLIGWGEDRALIKAKTNQEDELALELRRKGGRRVCRNGKQLSRHLDLIGPMRCVGFSALDLELIRGEPSLRRSWLDRVIQQLEPVYSDLTSRLSRLLKQRSQFYKQFHAFSLDERTHLLDTFDSQLALVSTRIHRRRSRMLKHLQPLAALWQQHLSNGNEVLQVQYCSGSQLEGAEDELTWTTSIEKQLLNQRSEEEKTGKCRIGPHRDEVSFFINDFDARRFASAGQQRTIVLSLKMAELQLMTNLHGQSPLLLLDDVLAELDPSRQLLLLDAVGDKYQCLISATHLESFECNWQTNSQIVELDSLI